MNNRVTLIATVLNELRTLPEFLEGIDHMTRRPDEIIIVDGGSRDGTAELLGQIASGRSDLTVLTEAGCSIARGRNIAIRQSRAEIIAVTDAGAIVDPSWLEEILAPFFLSPPADVVGGWYETAPVTPFERLVSRLQPPLNSVDPSTFLPSARSLAFRRSSWELVGGFPEELTNWAEDTVFARRLRDSGQRFAFAPRAVVRWRPRPDVLSFARQYFNYGRGDGEAGIDRTLNLKRVVFIAGFVVFFAALGSSMVVSAAGGLIAIAGFIRLLAPLRKAGSGYRTLAALAPLLFLREGAQVAGYVIGLLSGKGGKT